MHPIEFLIDNSFFCGDGWWNSFFSMTACSDPGIVFRPPEDDDEEEEDEEAAAEERAEEGRVTDPQADLAGLAYIHIQLIDTYIHTFIHTHIYT